MKSRNIAILSLTTLAIMTGISLAAGANEDSVVPGEILVGFRPEHYTLRSIQTLSTWGRVAGSQPAIDTHRLKLNPGVRMDAAIAALSQREDIAFAEPNHIRHACAANDPYFSYQWAPLKVQADLSWSIWSPKAQIIVAVVDTGVDGKHPDLVNQMLTDASGIVGYDALQGKRDPAADGFGHGTHCAGIIDAQVNNGTGIAGLAGYSALNAAGQSGALPIGIHALGLSSNSVKIMPVKVLDSNGSGTDASVANGVIWAADHGAKVISISLGGPDSSSTMSNACNYAWNKGCVLIAASGNDGVSTKFYPAACSNVISVGATDSSDSLASFSNWGSWVDIAAPGDTILSTLPTYQVQPGWPLNYGYMSGTSMAAPHVAAEAAMLFAQNPGLSNAQVVSIITANVDIYHPFSGHTLAPGAGRMNLYRALQAAGASAPVVPSVPDAPKGLTATTTIGTVKLLWNTVNGAASYNIKRAVKSGGAYTIVATNAKGTAFTDSGRANGVVYYYVVSAVNLTGEGANSVEVKAITPSPPAAPSGLTGKAVGTTVQLAWKASGSGDVVQINVYRSTKDGTGFVLIKSLGKVTAYTDTQPLRNGYAYYAVKAINSAGQESAFSNQATIPGPLPSH